MTTMTHRLFLLRAYGDACITLHFLVNSPEKNDYTVIASSHLKPLIIALSNYIDIASLKIEFVNLAISTSQLNIFTNRHLISTVTISQVKKLVAFLKANPNTMGYDYIEQQKRCTLLNTIANHDFKAIVKNNVYDEMAHFFKAKTNVPEVGDTINEILVLPDARIPARQIPNSAIEYIFKQSQQLNKNMRVGYFANTQFTKQQEGYNNYNSFDELLKLINKADFIFGSDSLPIHLCNALNKPHYILYPKNGSKAFFTPYCITNNHYANFEKFNTVNFPI